MTARSYSTDGPKNHYIKFRGKEKDKMKLVIIESPYAGDVAANLKYLDCCIKDSIARGEAPYASHALYPNVLDDSIPTERQLGIELGFAWGKVAHEVAVYIDNGVSNGMRAAINYYVGHDIELSYRRIYTCTLEVETYDKRESAGVNL